MNSIASAVRNARARRAWNLEALEAGSEISAMKFADWMAAEEQRDELCDLLSYLADDDVVKALARRWAEEEMQ